MASATQILDASKYLIQPSYSIQPNQKLIEYCKNKYLSNAHRSGVIALVVGVAAETFANCTLSLNRFLSTVIGLTFFCVLGPKKDPFHDEYFETMTALEHSPDFVKFAESKQLMTPETILQARKLYLQQPGMPKEFWGRHWLFGIQRQTLNKTI